MSNADTITQIASLQPSALVELWVLDATAQGGGIIRYHNYGGAPILWQGNTYNAFPVQASGFEHKTKDTLPRPTLTFSNVLGTMTTLCNNFNDLIGAKVTRKRTFKRFLDGQPTSDPLQGLRDDVFLIESKLAHSNVTVAFELTIPLDLEGIAVPRRIMTADVCAWKYRGAECSFFGTFCSMTSADTYVTGLTGPVNPRGTFVLGTAYATGDLVCDTESGLTVWYIARLASTGQSLTSSTYWTKVQTNRGAWVAGTYVMGDVVSATIEGGRAQFYVCNKASTTQEPPGSDWDADQCSRTAIGCQARFGAKPAAGLPFGGFPGTRRFQS